MREWKEGRGKVSTKDWQARWTHTHTCGPYIPDRLSTILLCSHAPRSGARARLGWGGLRACPRGSAPWAGSTWRPLPRRRPRSQSCLHCPGSRRSCDGKEGRVGEQWACACRGHSDARWVGSAQGARACQPAGQSAACQQAQRCVQWRAQHCGTHMKGTQLPELAL